MKKIKVAIICLIVFSCKTQDTNKDEIIIQKFIDNIIFKDDSTFEDSMKYVEYSNEMLKQKDLIFKFIKAVDKNDFKNYKIISRKEALKLKMFKELNYSDEYKTSETYHVLSKGEVVTTLIVRKGKIHSLCSNMIKSSSDIRTPFMLSD
ncbi:MAG: hypothetical protein KGV44_10360 [Flavobacteriaceae bacterium]|nr:hypothetical protein [Flavobacteriaceae bacterium]